MINTNDPVLKSIIKKLREDFNCHTIFLYGSRARGLETSTSDYDVTGICRHGEKTRIVKKQKGFFWDVFVYPEKDLRILGESHFSWKGAKLIYSEGSYGKKFITRLEKLLLKPYKPQPKFEIDVLKVWAHKELERCRVNDIQGLYRRAEFHNALIDHYFFIRQKRFLGPKESFSWLLKHDPLTYKLIHKSLKNPMNLSMLKAAALRVYKIKA